MDEKTPLKIFGRKNSINVMKVLWCCDHLGVPFERFDVGGAFGFDGVADYISMNPNQRVPTIDDNGFVLWESNVIVRYLASIHGQGTLYPSDPASRWEAEKWMDWQQTTLGGKLMVVFWGLVRTPPEKRDLKAIESSRLEMEDLWRIVDTHLADREYIAGNSFTMGDIPLGACAYRWYGLDMERPVLSHVEAWYERLCTQEPFREHVMQPLT